MAMIILGVVAFALSAYPSEEDFPKRGKEGGFSNGGEGRFDPTNPRRGKIS